jgi:xylulokinase
MTVLLGVDAGSSGAKAVAFDVEGRILARASATYPTNRPRPGWAEQDPEDWYRGCCAAIREALSAGTFAAADVAAVSFCGPAHNVALLDADGGAVRPTLHWSDLRSAPQSDRIEAERGDAVFSTTGQRCNPVWTLPQLAWLRENEPEALRRLRRILVTKDYVRFRFTGEFLTDPYDAVGTMLCTLEDARWSTELLDLAGLGADAVPRVVPSTASAGVVGAVAAADSGLRAGTPVAVGSGDSPVEAFGAGALEPGACIVKIGTSACVNLVTSRPRPDRRCLTYPHLAPGRGFSITATNAGTATLQWLRDAFFPGRPFEDVVAMAATVPPGAEGLVFHPYLAGERTPHWDPRRRADFAGINARHTAAHFVRAALEGVAFSIRECAAVVSSLGEPVRHRVLLGGGSRSPLWARMAADAIGEPLELPEVDDAAFGAALLAGTHAGVYRDLSHAAARGARGPRPRIEPDPRSRETFDLLYPAWRDAAAALAAPVRALVDFSERSDA